MNNRSHKLPILSLVIIAGTAFFFTGRGALAQQRSRDEFSPVIAFVSSRDHPRSKTISELFLAIEIYLSDMDGKNARRLTTNKTSDCYPNLSPDGKRIVFDSGRLRSKDDPDNMSDLFIMGSDGANQTHLVRGSSATWSPDGKHIAYHASASG